MQERAYEEVETLWPYGGFTVRASERKLGEGKLTLTEQSLLFEAKTRRHDRLRLPHSQADQAQGRSHSRSRILDSGRTAKCIL